ncbi:MAG TPA: hypothetical protein VM187_19225 [Niastella sp.]|nr:hypothetical protein [Niastella sp.]
MSIITAVEINHLISDTNSGKQGASGCEVVNDNTENLHIFQNPTYGALIIIYNGNVTKEPQFTFYDASGKKVFVLQADEVTKTKGGVQLEWRINNGFFIKAC